jgi:hypothetical protein
MEELIANSTEGCEVREVRDERRELDEVVRTCVGSLERGDGLRNT